MPEESGLKNIINENQAALLRYAERLLNDDTLAQDAVQTAFIKYIKSRNQKIKNPRAWLFKILRNHCFNILRKRKTRAEIMLDDRTLKDSAHSNTPDRNLINAETSKLLRQSINKLKPRHKEVVILKLEHGKSYKEIAAVLDLTVSNVGFILHSAMNELKNDLREALSR
jgi:RNA polymerase sigma-70 factor (ECF subfamily)